MKTRFYYAGIRVQNLKHSIDFYTKVLGMKVVRRDRMGHSGEWVHLVTPRSRLRLELNYCPEGSKFYSKYMHGEEMDHLAFVVEDVKEAFKEFVKKGAGVAVDPAHSKGTEVYIKDPDGIWIELLQA
jgi:lactoylglutathione lyase